MQFSVSPRALLIAASSFALTSAQNAFTMTTIPSVIHASSAFNITWGATTPGSVSLWLVQGPASDTKYVQTIAANITNSGSFVWVPGSQTPTGSQYALEIVDDANSYITNYSGQFAIDGGSTDSSGNSTDTSSSASSDSSSTTVGSASSSTMSTSTTKSASSTDSSATSSPTSSTASVPNSNSGAAEGAVMQSFASLLFFAVAAMILL